MNDASTSRRGRIRRPAHGFRRYRAVIVVGWLVFLAVLVWVTLIRPDRYPDKRPPLQSDSGQTKIIAPAARVGHSAAAALPTDDAPHDKASEGWHYRGHLETDTGERYSFHIATFLRQGTPERAAFHGALRDHQTGKPYIDQARTHDRSSADRGDGYSFGHGPWKIAGSGPRHGIKMAGKGFALELTLDDDQPPVRHGTSAGLIDMGAAGKSHYVSRPRMKAEGRLVVEGVGKAVRGTVWFDHQWGDLEATSLRSNRFALQLADGADLMIYEVFDRQGAPLSRTGTYVKDGAVSVLAADDFQASPHGTWKSKLTGVVYPMDWTIAVPSRGIDLSLEAVVRTSQFDARLTTLNVYWEGAVKAGGSPGGVGFIELNGYPSEAAAAAKTGR